MAAVIRYRRAGSTGQWRPPLPSRVHVQPSRRRSPSTADRPAIFAACDASVDKDTVVTAAAATTTATAAPFLHHVLGVLDDRQAMELRVGNKYRLGRKIGSGSFGDIYLGKSTRGTNVPYSLSLYYAPPHLWQPLCDKVWHEWHMPSLVVRDSRDTGPQTNSSIITISLYIIRLSFVRFTVTIDVVRLFVALDTVYILMVYDRFCFTIFGDIHT